LLIFGSANSSESKEVIDKLKSIYNRKNEHRWGKTIPFEIVYISCDINLKLYRQAVTTMPWPSLYYTDGYIDILKSEFQIESVATMEPRISLVSPESGSSGDHIISSHVTDVLLQRSWYSETPVYWDYYTFGVLLRYVKDYNKRQKFIDTFNKKHTTSDAMHENSSYSNETDNYSCTSRTAHTTEEFSTDVRVYEEDCAYRRSGNTVRKCTLRRGYPNLKIKARKCLRDSIEPFPIDVSDLDMNSYGGRAFAGCHLQSQLLHSLPDSMVYRRGPKTGSRYYPMKSKRINKGKNSRQIY
jgi:hypothetical protein